ncbi:MAG: hypothetical protein LBM75_02375 [Myxococcales bacterium]|jgi:hypothetical protein|nr:hypothetical protein [Myxococcales bacterium]
MKKSKMKKMQLSMIAMLAATSMSFTAACDRATPVPAPPGLAVIPANQGSPYMPRALLLTIRDRALVLPSGEVCPASGACPALSALRGEPARPLAIDFEAGLLMAELSQAFDQIAQVLAFNEALCLRVSGAGMARCLDVHPRSAEALGAWMDAEKPLAKIRLMVRADGMEVVTVRGKIPGPDRYGPSIPTKSGSHDFNLLASSLAKLAAFLPSENEAALLSSPRTTAQTAARALGALGNASEEQFEKLVFIY